MQSEFAKIYFYFPQTKSKTKQEFVNSIISLIQKDGMLKRAGYLNEKKIPRDIYRQIGRINHETKIPTLTPEQEESIWRDILRAITKSHRTLSHPQLPVFVYVYPWFPNSQDSKLFRGVTAYAIYLTIHLFIDIKNYSKESLYQTIVHEWNHLVFYQYHIVTRMSIRTGIVMEGLAEVFREELVDGPAAPWSTALKKHEVQRKLKMLGATLDSKSEKQYREVFFGEGNRYKRWTGYSIGYWLVKKFRERHKHLSWAEMIRGAFSIVD